jgi:hypothetical protein
LLALPIRWRAKFRGEKDNNRFPRIFPKKEFCKKRSCQDRPLPWARAPLACPAILENLALAFSAALKKTCAGAFLLRWRKTNIAELLPAGQKHEDDRLTCDLGDHKAFRLHRDGAAREDRTLDLSLTKGVLYH